jgi:adenylyltransferase/sulfurtransferase
MSNMISDLQNLSNEEMRRYSRHLLLPEIGVKGQKVLKAARVLVVGLGGLGSPVAMYLAAAGIGTLGIVDFDRVDESNLQRQVIHGTSTLGMSKIASATTRIADLNPFVQVVAHEMPLNRDNALNIIEKYDIVVDGTDNFQTRYLVNDACILLNKINVYGSIYRFDGQVSVFGARASNGPCYRCLFPAPPPPGEVPSCAEGGVLGVLPGVIGTLQATEVIKLITGAGDPLIGRLLIYDALEMSVRQMKLRRRSDCPVCGDNPTITTLIDYDEFCGVTPTMITNNSNHDALPEITVTELKRRMNDGLGTARLIDVRETNEWDIARVPNATLIPMNTIPNHIDELAQASELLILCRSGRRSADVVRFLMSVGFKNVKNVKGGTLAWSREVDPSVPTY